MWDEINFIDSNDVDQNEWMKYTYCYTIKRVDQNIELYISSDGINYNLSRSFQLPNGVDGTQRIIIDQEIWNSAGSYVDWDYFKVMQNDIAPAEIIITGVEDGATYTESVTPEINITDDESGISTQSIKLNGEDYVSGTSIIEKGSHTLIVNATDNAGNESPQQTINFTINKSTNINAIAMDSQYSDNTTITAKLTSERNPVEGKLVNFEFNGIYIGSATTDENGIAAFKYKIDLPTGTYPVKAYFEEYDNFNASDEIININVTEENASILYDGNHLVEISNSVTLSAKVSENEDGSLAEDLSNVNVDFELLLVNSNGTTTPTGTYNVLCNALGEAAITTETLGVGVYSIVAKINGNGYYEESEITAMCVVYNSDDGQASGGGWIAENSNKSNFGFTVKYNNGLATGNLEFQSKESDINLKSEQIDWFVINCNEANFEGTGTIKNLDGEYKFRINCLDLNTDKFTIKIWQGSETNVIYEALNVELGGGNIKVKET